MYSGQKAPSVAPKPLYPKSKQIFTYLATLPNLKTITIIGKTASGQVFETSEFEMSGLSTSIDISKYFPFIERCVEKDGILKICVSEHSNESVEGLSWKKLYGFMTVDGGPICRLSGPQAKLLHEALMVNDDHRTFITYG